MLKCLALSKSWPRDFFGGKTAPSRETWSVASVNPKNLPVFSKHTCSWLSRKTEREKAKSSETRTTSQKKALERESMINMQQSWKMTNWDLLKFIKELGNRKHHTWKAWFKQGHTCNIRRTTRKTIEYPPRKVPQSNAMNNQSSQTIKSWWKTTINIHKLSSNARKPTENKKKTFGRHCTCCTFGLRTHGSKVEVQPEQRFFNFE